jgi:mRNA interferase HigB
LRQTFPGADPVRVTSGRTVVVFNIAGNQYRLLTAIHDNMRKIFVLRFLTHAEYTRETSKDEL